MKTLYAALLATALLVACGKDEPKPAHDHDHDHDGGGEHSKIEKAMAALPAADRKLAEAQKDCPVSGKPLGAMGTPIKLEVKGRTVFLCCEGCREPIEKNPDKYLAKLK